MKRVTFWAALVIASWLATSTAAITQAAPPMQEITLTPTATHVRIPGPTWTPTPTMLALPPNGGRVAVSAAAVRLEPFPDSPSIGSLPYNSEVIPLGRSVRGGWVAINWNNQPGWVLAELVTWGSDFDLNSLPILLPPYNNITLIAPTNTATTAAITETAVPSDTPQPSATITPEASETAAPTAAPTQTPSPDAAVIAAVPSAVPAPPPNDPQFTLPIGEIMPFAGIGLPILLLGLYGWQFAKGQQELRRYAKTFPLANCPVCQFGTLSLDETILRPLGIARVARTVRCNNCRSMLRQTDVGEWRYTIDPYINPALAAEFDGKTFNDAELRDFAITAAAFPPHVPEAELEALPPLTDEEILADLEARIPPPDEDIPEAASEDGDLIETPPEDQPSE